MTNKLVQKMFPVCALLLLLSISFNAHTGGIYQEPSAFINDVFDNTPPKPAVIWPDAHLKKQLAEILAHKYKGLRIRYWKQGATSAWVLNEIGKEKPITTGIVIEHGKIKQVKVLAFRESRGWEIRHDFFTDQFKQASLVDDNRMNKHIDNISGATLSVRAVTKLARIALLLDKKIQDSAD